MFFLIFSSLLLSCSLLPGQPVLESSADLTVIVSNIQARGAGEITILLFDAPEKFGPKIEKASHRVVIEDFGQSARHTFQDLPSGTYAIMAFQDLNNNGALDKNFIGFPKEPLVAYQMKRLGKPSFKKSSITLSDQPVSVELKLLNQ